MNKPERLSAASVQLQAAPMSAAARTQLEQTAAALLQHDADGTFPVADDVMSMPGSRYTCPEQFEREKARIFRRVPLVLAASCELPQVGSYKTIEVAGIPVLLTRGRDGAVNAMLNSCTHRGAAVAQGCGVTARMTCPYHGWTFGLEGNLLGIASPADFGAVEKAALHLKRFPVAERGGLVWVILDSDSTADPAAMLGGIDTLLDGFGLAEWTYVESRGLPGPNWKLAFDAHLEFYHVPVLHRDTFGPDRSNRALYFAHGPHQRVIAPRARPGTVAADDLFALGRLPAGDEPVGPLMTGEWIVFPGVSINIFHPNGLRGVFMSTVLPGPTVSESVTIQTFLSETPPDEATRAEIARTCDFLAHVVGDEDLPTSAHQQKALATGILPEVRFGRNEGGLQHFHRWIDALVEAPDEDLPGMLAAQCR